MTNLELFVSNIHPDLPGDQLQALKEKLATEINHMIEKRFEDLVNLLYRLDIDEGKLRKLLDRERGTDAGLLIAESIIQRQLKKWETRRSAPPAQTDIPDDEQW